MPVAPPGHKTLRAFYKQRFLSLCVVGEQAQLDKLQGPLSAALLSLVLDVLQQGVGLDPKTFIAPHPALVAAARLRQVSRQNAAEWAENMNRLMQEASWAASLSPAQGPRAPRFAGRAVADESISRLRFLMPHRPQDDAGHGPDAASGNVGRARTEL